MKTIRITARGPDGDILGSVLVRGNVTTEEAMAHALQSFLKRGLDVMDLSARVVTPSSPRRRYSSTRHLTR